MPEYLAPGVYVEEIEIGAKPIEGVSTSTVGFFGPTEGGGFFRNGGQRFFIGRIVTDDAVATAVNNQFE